VRSTPDLVSLDYAFTQLHCLTPADFLREARSRDVFLADVQLKGLHRARVLVPLLRVRRDGRAIAAIARRDLNEAYDAAHWQPTSVDALRRAQSAGLLTDPARERFRPPGSVRRKLGELTYETSIYLYSPHQLISLPHVREVLPSLRWRSQRSELVASLPADPRKARWVAQGARLREIVVAVSALEPIYYSRVVQSLRLPLREDLDAYDKWRRTLPLGRMLRWLGVNASWLRDAAAGLLADADRLDPLGEWAELVARGEPATWSRLRGDARIAIDFRIGAEVLLRYYDDLVAAGRAKPLPEPSPMVSGTFDYRLKRRRPLDALLTHFGLSPHPRLVLIVEGATERMLFPRVMRTLGFRIERDFIAIEDAGGADRDISQLLAYLAPRLDEKREKRYVRYERPPTRFLVVLDPEGKSATFEQREKRREGWIERIMLTLPKELQTPLVREQVSRLVYIATWKRSGESFEFAHFTDLELATVIHSLDGRSRKPSVSTLRSAIWSIREARGALDKVVDDACVRKPDLADALWPTLERKIENALAHDSAGRIPIVRIVNRAVRLAQELPRRNIVIVLEREPNRKN